jgi:ribosome-binding protein aMBF1 (putative translation factor)
MAKKKLSIGEQIKVAREAKGLSRDDLGRDIDRSREYVKYIEDDVRKPRRYQRALIEKVLGITITD